MDHPWMGLRNGGLLGGASPLRRGGRGRAAHPDDHRALDGRAGGPPRRRAHGEREESAIPADPNEDACTDWEIRTADLSRVVWHADCATGVLSHHIHLGDGSYVPFHGSQQLDFASDYVVRARFHDSEGEIGDWAERRFTTSPPSSPGGGIAWTPLQPGYVIDEIAGGLQLPTDIAFVPDPGPGPKDPVLYLTELYGTIKVITRDGTVSDYATRLLNFPPTGDFPGSGELGLTGIVVDPVSGDVFASMLYDSDPSPAIGPLYPKVVRFHSDDGGLTSDVRTTTLDMVGETEGPSHQISNLSIGPDQKLYVHLGDAFDPATAQNLSSFRGKILRVDLNGTAPADNPFYNAADGSRRPTTSTPTGSAIPSTGRGGQRTAPITRSRTVPASTASPASRRE